jgi:N4-gp56 family major capsid protein
MANEITSANVAQAIVKLVAARALPALVGNLVMGSLVNRDYEPTLAQAGDTINVPIPPVMTANNIAEGGTVQNQNPSLGNAQIVLNSHVEATFTIPDVVKVLAAPDLVEVYMRPAINAIAEKVETDLLSLYPLLTANSPVGSGGTALTEATIDAAETALFVAKVPQSAQKYLVVSPTAYSQLRQLSRFTEQQTAGSGEPILTGTLGRIKDFVVVRSQYVPTVSGTTYNVAFARDAFGLVIRRLPQPLPGTGAVAEYVEQGNFGLRVIMSYQPNTLSQQFTVDVLYGVGVLRNNFAVVVRN